MLDGAGRRRGPTLQLTSPIALLYGFDLNGDQLFAVGRPNDNAQPVVGPTGNVYVESWVNGAGIRLRSYDADGHVRWTAFGSPTNVLSHPDVGPDESVYAVRNGRELWSLSGESMSSSGLKEASDRTRKQRRNTVREALETLEQMLHDVQGQEHEQELQEVYSRVEKLW